MKKLAIDGGTPVRAELLPYGHQWIGEDDIEAVTQVLRSAWLTTGPKVAQFEEEFAKFVGASHSIALSNGTAALHACMYALGIAPGDEVIVPPLTFAATANCVVFQGGTPIFADVHPDTLLLDAAEVKKRISSKTKAIISVDYAGQPCDYDELRAIASHHGLALVADACHSLGGSYKGQAVGGLADLNVFSSHPVKAFTTGEGGIITTNQSQLAQRIRIFRNHGMNSDHKEREARGSWFYEMIDLGYNYRLTDIQCALGISQLKKVREWIARRQFLASFYEQALKGNQWIQPLACRADVSHAYHLFVARLSDQVRASRGSIFSALRAEGIGVNVHYVPVHLHPFYQQRFGTTPGMCPRAEEAYEKILTLPLFPRMSDQDANDVVDALSKVLTTLA